MSKWKIFKIMFRHLFYKFYVYVNVSRIIKDFLLYNIFLIFYEFYGFYFIQNTYLCDVSKRWKVYVGSFHNNFLF